MKQKIITANTMENKTYISLGTNIGEREENLKQAILEIEKIAKITQKSEIIETEPEGYKEQNRFLNMVIEIETEIDAPKLLKMLLEIEEKMGRKRSIKNGPRIIDIDILLYKNEVIESDKLEIPHPRMHERSFVLNPLAQIAPTVMHPWLNKTITELKKQL